MATWVVYSPFKLSMCVNANNANLAAGGDTIKVMLANSNYTPNPATDQFLTTPAASEVRVGNGGAGSYSTGGLTISGTQTCTLTSNTVTYTNSNSTVIVWAQDSANYFTAQYAVLYKSTGTAANSPLICYVNLGANYTNQGGSLTLQLDANGVFTLT